MTQSWSQRSVTRNVLCRESRANETLGNPAMWIHEDDVPIETLPIARLRSVSPQRKSCTPRKNLPPCNTRSSSPRGPDASELRRTTKASRGPSTTSTRRRSEIMMDRGQREWDSRASPASGLQKSGPYRHGCRAIAQPNRTGPGVGCRTRSRASEGLCAHTLRCRRSDRRHRYG